MDFFETIRSFYMNETFCDLEIVSYKSGDDFSRETVKCHSVVLSSAVPSLRPIFEANDCVDEPATVVVVVHSREDGEFLLKGIVDNIYDCLAGAATPSVEHW
jgi:hypothetical protein